MIKLGRKRMSTTAEMPETVGKTSAIAEKPVTAETPANHES
jgi:hypothetical protein